MYWIPSIFTQNSVFFVIQKAVCKNARNRCVWGWWSAPDPTGRAHNAHPESQSPWFAGRWKALPIPHFLINFDDAIRVLLALGCCASFCPTFSNLPALKWWQCSGPHDTICLLIYCWRWNSHFCVCSHVLCVSFQQKLDFSFVILLLTNKCLDNYEPRLAFVLQGLTRIVTSKNRNVSPCIAS